MPDAWNLLNGIGALMPWADRLYMLSYLSVPGYGAGTGLYEIDEQLSITKVANHSSVFANRMIHHWTDQVVVGPYVIDAQRNIRIIESLLHVRIGAMAEHLHTPETHVYMVSMDGPLYEVDLTTLVAELQARVDEVSVATPAIDWTDAFDKAALSVHADRIFIMGYDYHWGGGDPGPIAPLEGGSPWAPWSLTDSLETYLAEGADPDRIVLGLPLYGRTWPTTNNTVPGTSTGRASSVTMVNGIALAATHGRLYDTVTDTPYTFISSTSQTWYDDHASIQLKVHWAIEAGLGGIGFWALNYEGNDPAFWDMITAETTGLDPVDPVDTGDSGGGTADDGGSDGGSSDGGGGGGGDC